VKQIEIVVEVSFHTSTMAPAKERKLGRFAQLSFAGGVIGNRQSLLQTKVAHQLRVQLPRYQQIVAR